MLGAGERGAFAGGPAGDQEVDAGLDLPADQAPERLFIERKIALERGYQRGATACEHVPPPWQKPTAPKFGDRHQRPRGAKTEPWDAGVWRSEEHTSELQSLRHLV